MVKLQIITVLMVVASGAAHAAEISGRMEPIEMVQKFYRPYQLNVDPSDLDSLPESSRLMKLRAKVRFVDHDFFVQGQDYEIKNLKIEKMPSDKQGHQFIAATFLNFTTPVKIRFDFVRTGSKWTLDEAYEVGKNPPAKYSEDR